MALIRWQPFQEMETCVVKWIKYLMGVNREAQMTWKPAVEIKDTEGQPDSGRKFCVGKDLDIRVTREAVAIAGEHRYEKS